MSWYRWPSLAEFTKWHEAAKAALDIPRPGRGLSSGRERTANQWTLAYTEAYVVADDDVRAIVEDDALHIPGIGEPCGSPLRSATLEERLADKSGDDAAPVWILTADAVTRLQLAEQAAEQTEK